MDSTTGSDDITRQGAAAMIACHPNMSPHAERHHDSRTESPRLCGRIVNELRQDDPQRQRFRRHVSETAVAHAALSAALLVRSLVDDARLRLTSTEPATGQRSDRRTTPFDTSWTRMGASRQTSLDDVEVHDPWAEVARHAGNTVPALLERFVAGCVQYSLTQEMSDR